jgi:transposase-like protein
MGHTGAMINLQSLMDDAKCFATVRDMRWLHGVTCRHCESPEITKQGHDDTKPERQRYWCKSCERRFDDLTDTIFAGHHQPLRVWILCSYLMGLNVSTLLLDSGVLCFDIVRGSQAVFKALEK